ncbi:PDDEXK nuclease domain-containing protein [Olivibacter ginsenosidimutans]|uniref:PDDEXK nuclease domain-containing protein n=1 Tax=Olivibacter ginsenosidimutans TaxID=1176537 RepID=A0ABP9AWX2_9SPHI
MEIDNTYIQFLGELKKKIRQAQQRAALSVNTEMLILYWSMGNDISNKIKEAGWGAKIVNQISKDLKTEFPEMNGFSPRNLRYMRSFAEAYPEFLQADLAKSDETILQPAAAKLENTEIQQNSFLQPVVAKIPWTHHTIILDKVKSAKYRLFYIHKTAENGWSKSVLSFQIESKLHERQGEAITNFDTTLPKSQSDLAKQTLKSPYIFDFLGIGEDVQERELEKALIQHIRKVMLELGKGFAYVGNQYHLQVDNEDFYLDLLFYNFHLHCFVVFELKIGDFKPEYAGKLNFYVNAIDEQIKSKHDNQTIGVLLCKTPNETVIKYSLKGINSPLGVADYQLPKKLKSDMPTIEELESAIKELKDG